MIKKILFVSHEHNAINGSTISMSDLIGAIQLCSDIQCEVLLPRKGVVEQYLKNQGICVHTSLFASDIRRIGNRRVLRDTVRNNWNLVIGLILTKLAKTQRYDLIISNSTAVDVGATIAKYARVKHLYYVRELMKYGLKFEFLNEKRVMTYIENSDYVVYISQYLKHFYEEKIGIIAKNTIMIHDGLNTDGYYLEKHIVFQHEKIHMVQIGYVSLDKNQMSTLHTIKMLRERGYTNFYVEFIGKGNKEYMDQLERYVNENNLGGIVHFLGYSSNIKEILSSTDIVINNSAIEGLGRTTIEGMLAGCLVVGRNAGATPELIQSGCTGFMFQTEKELCDLLIYINENKKKAQDVAFKGREWAVSEFDNINMAKKFLKFIGY